jgi:cell division protein FtsN
MKTNETGEFELVLGNRQLLSGFFIVVLLFGVAFAMGYIVGRNSAPSPKLQAEAAGTNSPAPEGGPPRPQPAASAAPATAPEPAAAAPAADAKETSETPAQPTTQPARETPAAPAAEAPAPAAAPPAEPPLGTYWQVMAVKQTEGEIVVRTLKDKGFPAQLGPGPSNLMRVLVGPYNDTQSLGRAKSELENAGFHPILKR